MTLFNTYIVTNTAHTAVVIMGKIEAKYFLAFDNQILFAVYCLLQQLLGCQ